MVGEVVDPEVAGVEGREGVEGDEVVGEGSKGLNVGEEATILTAGAKDLLRRCGASCKSISSFMAVLWY